MQNAMWLASIFGPFLMIVGIWMLFYHDNMMKVVTSMKNTPGIMYLSGVMNLMVGLTVVSLYNMWNWNLPLLVTLFGWVILIRGLMAFFVPQYLLKRTMNDSKTLKVKGVILLVWGFFMCWLAFWM